MPQTTTAMNVAETVVELSVDGTTWTNVSGSLNKVEVSPQTIDSGMAATLEGQYKVVRSGKYNPVEAAVKLLYTETAGEAYEIVYSRKNIPGNTLWLRWTPGGYNGDKRFYSADANGNKAAGRITEFPYPGADAEAGGPHLVTFKLQATQFARENATPSPSASLSPSASSSA